MRISAWSAAPRRSADPQPDRSTMRLLVIEDDRDAADYLIKSFREVGHIAEQANDGETGLARALDSDFDVLIVDRMLPKREGLSVIAALRTKGVNTPVLILSALGQVDDRVKGLRAGGDDYLAKPYSFSELLARTEVLARRGKGPQSRVLKVGGLTYNLDTLTVTREGKSIQLNPIGLKLLQALMEASPSVVTRQDLEQRVWGEELPDSDSLRVHIHGLRAAIDKPFMEEPFKKEPLIHTRHGIGYRMVDPDAVQT